MVRRDVTDPGCRGFLDGWGGDGTGDFLFVFCLLLCLCGGKDGVGEWNVLVLERVGQRYCLCISPKGRGCARLGVVSKVVFGGCNVLRR